MKRVSEFLDGWIGGMWQRELSIYGAIHSSDMY